MSNKHLVAIFGGAVSGSEAAFQLAERGIPCVVFEQNLLPFGKIEDGLPKWHVKLRDKEEGKIITKLSHPLVEYVPNAKLGSNIDFEDLTGWGFSAILLAIGAWRDRPLPIDGIDDYIGSGLIYQNPFIYWYNHKHEPEFRGTTYPIADGAAIIGGGLASLDVAKVLMFELVEKALKKLGHTVNLFELDRSIAKVLDKLGVAFEDLGIEGCTIYYRRRIKDMPLSPFPTDTPEKLAKAEAVREKILNNYRSKYLFNIKPQHMPVGKVVENGELVGLHFQQTKIENGRAVALPETEHEVRAPYFISSIGSIPEKIPGIPARGSVFDVEDQEFCRIAGYKNVFALGNAVTGRGNINESLKHGREIANKIIEAHFQAAAQSVDAVVDAIEGTLSDDFPISEEAFGALMNKVKALQQSAGYAEGFERWAARHTPVRLEAMIGAH